ncbi:MAG: superoxide dismutase [Gammaproteobacteria bacterium]|nr:superoxide dismutase [Gammaproteobacteria bacterium]
MAHTLPELPYPKNALEPHISAETMEYHHDKHHKTYIDTVNQLIDGTDLKNASLEEIIKGTDNQKLFNNASQAWNHNLFWQCMSPDGGGAPQGKLASAIESSFGSFDDFKKEFKTTATSVFGAGWAWLVKDKSGKLAVRDLKHAGRNPIAESETALFGLDMWEHAYYIDYRNVKADYVEHFWEVANWDFIARKLDK